MATARRLHSTDRDLLVAQAALGKVRHPDLNDKELMDMAMKAENKLEARFMVLDLRGKPVEHLPKHRQRRVYDMTVTFENKVQTKLGLYNLRATFQLRNVEGTGLKAAESIDDAKENFRKKLGLLIRDESSPIYKKFFDMVKVEILSQKEVEPDAFKAGVRLKLTRQEDGKIKEAFRKWIGNSIRDSSSKIYKEFFKIVSYEEVREMRTCVECHKELPATHFAYPAEISPSDIPAGMDPKKCRDCNPELADSSEDEELDEGEEEDEDAEEDLEEEDEDEAN